MSNLPGWDSLEATSRYHGFLEISGIVFLALLVVAETLTFMYGHRADDLTKQQQEDAQRSHETEITALHRDTAQLSAEAEGAKAHIATANAAAASANERIATLSADAETARAQIATANEAAAKANALAAQIQQAAAWRILSPVTRLALPQALAKGIGGSVTLSYDANDSEALFLATQLKGAFDEANRIANRPLWNVSPQGRQLLGAIFFELRVFGQKDDVVTSIRSAFFATGVGFITESIPQGAVNSQPGLFSAPQRRGSPVEEGSIQEVVGRTW